MENFTGSTCLKDLCFTFPLLPDTDKKIPNKWRFAVSFEKMFKVTICKAIRKLYSHFPQKKLSWKWVSWSLQLLWRTESEINEEVMWTITMCPSMKGFFKKISYFNRSPEMRQLNCTRPFCIKTFLFFEWWCKNLVTTVLNIYHYRRPLLLFSIYSFTLRGR